MAFVDVHDQSYNVLNQGNPTHILTPTIPNVILLLSYF
jgi:hypothetical protein